ncbi:MAG TPA: HAD family phosphatase [Bacteroidota bacterium]|nr:HAD family phosphatase [Bacteroidota bacterium]
MLSPSVVLFDLGNVLVDIDVNAFWCSIGMNTRAEQEPFFDGYEILTRQYETGLISTKAFLNNLYTLFAKKFTREQLQLAFERVIVQPIDGMVDIVKELAKTRRTALVSNTNELHYTVSYARLESLRTLHTQYLSYRLNVMKPDAGFYTSILHDLRMNPSEMIFIDDLEANIEGARLAGMQTIRFEGVEQLKRKLNRLGIL